MCAVSISDASLASIHSRKQHNLPGFLEYLSPSYIFHVLQRSLINEDLLYPIDHDIVSPATRIIFTRSKRTNEPICLKIWVPCKNGVYDTQDITRNTAYLVEGIQFNRKFAKDYILGIAHVVLTENTVLRGRLIKHPEMTKLKQGELYALVMKCLKENWRLDHHLHQNDLGSNRGVEFLAREIALMHRSLEKSPKEMGKPSSIAAKLALNIRLFEEALEELRYISHSPYELSEIEKCRLIAPLMKQTCSYFTKRFEQRYENGRIKRCHGDLKATNLWVHPIKSHTSEEGSYELLALDCVDFNPEFCHIDTLSDIAMLAIDIETRVSDSTKYSPDKNYGQRVARHFLTTYLQEFGENPHAAWPLLEYYMTEKAMICAYMSILYDGLPTLGRKYLRTAMNHAVKLEKLMAFSGQTSSKKSIASTQIVTLV